MLGVAAIRGKGLNHVSESSKKHGEGHGNWGDVKSGEEALEAEVGPVPTLPGEEEFGGESTPRPWLYHGCHLHHGCHLE